MLSELLSSQYEFLPQTDAYSSSFLCLEGYENIPSGFNLKLVPGGLPLRLWGDLSDWEFLTLSKGAEYCAFSAESGVFVIKLGEMKCSVWLMPSSQVMLERDTLIFCSAGHPIEGYCPPRCELNLSNSNMLMMQGRHEVEAGVFETCRSVSLKTIV